MKKTDFNFGWMYGHPGEKKKAVQLPHDAMLSDGRSADAPTGSAGAYFKAGVYEYEKTLTLPAQAAGETLLLQFEGVMRNAKVKVNGKDAGGAAYGYIPFWIDLKPYVNYGTENRIEVTADNSAQPASRWYAGGGIYRPVWLWEGGETYIRPQGLRVKTVSYREGKIEIEVLTGGISKICSAQIEITDADEKTVSSEAIPIQDGKGKTVITVPDAKLWDEYEPNLYTCRAQLVSDAEILDEAQTTFGIRQVEADSKRGFLVNGNSTLLRAGAVHHDNGVIGAASTPESEWRRVRILKENGFNTLRISHNPACEDLLNAADYYGTYVIDEGWDMWYNHKSTQDYAGQFMENWKNDVDEMVARDYSHPSVIMYSIGNEVSEPAQEKGVRLGKEIIDRFHTLDDSRPVTGGINIMIISQNAKGKGIYDEEGGRDDSAEKKTQGMNSTMFNFVTSMVGTSMNKMGNGKKADAASTPILDALDVCGYNYGSGRYPLEGKAHPGRVVYGSEIFPQDAAKNWAVIRQYPYLVGDTLWTAWDYIGECGVGAWAYTPDGKGFDKPYPWKLADCGSLDLLGDPNAEMYWCQAAWGLIDGVKITVQPANHPGVTPAKATWRGSNGLPSWSWSGCGGNKTVVEAFTSNSSVVELFLNEKRIGKKKVKENRAVFRAVYKPGTLKAVAYDASGRVVGEDVLISARKTLHLACSVNQEKTIKTQDADTVYVEIALCDNSGTVEMNRDMALSVTVEGGELLGFGSANPRTEDDFTSGSYHTYYGRAQAVIRRRPGADVTVEIRGEGNEGSGFKGRVSF